MMIVEIFYDSALIPFYPHFDPRTLLSIQIITSRCNFLPTQENLSKTDHDTSKSNQRQLNQNFVLS